jgi:hypothetical protein
MLRVIVLRSDLRRFPPQVAKLFDVINSCLLHKELPPMTVDERELYLQFQATQLHDTDSDSSFESQLSEELAQLSWGRQSDPAGPWKWMPAASADANDFGASGGMPPPMNVVAPLSRGLSAMTMTNLSNTTGLRFSPVSALLEDSGVAAALL